MTAMSVFEIQVVSDGRWKAKDVFEDYDAAYVSAERFERLHRPEQLRIRRIDFVRPDFTRERTMYDGGLQVRSERVAGRKHQEQEAFRQRVADRRIRQTILVNAPRNKKPLFSNTNPVYLTLVSLSICLTGLSALYWVEKAFMYF